MKETKYGFINYRCRKCKDIISIESKIPSTCTTEFGILIDQKYHKCKFNNGLEEGERAYCDMISCSENALRYADEIFIIDESGKYKNIQLEEYYNEMS